MRSKTTSEFVTPSISRASTTPSKPLMTVDLALIPHLPCGVTTKPFAFSDRAFERDSPVLRENSARFSWSSLNESPASRASSSMALSIIS